MKKLEWTTAQRKVNDLMPLEFNPRKISEAKRHKMIESLQRFNLVDIPVADFNGTVVSGHQRLRALQAIGRGEEVIDVRMPNRKLSDRELKEYNLLANTHFGEFDSDVFDEFFGDVDLAELGFSVEDFKVPAEVFGIDGGTDVFSLPDGDRAPFQQMTFTLADEQAELIKNSIGQMRGSDVFKYAETMGNENGNGNALYLIVSEWAGQRISL